MQQHHLMLAWLSPSMPRTTGILMFDGASLPCLHSPGATTLPLTFFPELSIPYVLTGCSALLVLNASSLIATQFPQLCPCTTSSRNETLTFAHVMHVGSLFHKPSRLGFSIQA